MKKFQLFALCLSLLIISTNITSSIDNLPKSVFCKHFDRKIEKLDVSPDHRYVFLHLSKNDTDKKKRLELIYWPEKKCKNYSIPDKDYWIAFDDRGKEFIIGKDFTKQSITLEKPINKKVEKKIRYPEKKKLSVIYNQKKWGEPTSIDLVEDWNSKNPKVIKKFAKPTPEDAELSPDQKLLKITHHDKSLEIYDIVNEKIIFKINKDQFSIFKFLYPDYFVICNNVKVNNQTKSWIKIFRNKQLKDKNLNLKLKEKFKNKDLTDISIKCTN